MCGIVSGGQFMCNALWSNSYQTHIESYSRLLSKFKMDSENPEYSDYAAEEWALYNYHNPDNESQINNYSIPNFYFTKPEGVHAVIVNVLMIVIYPMALLGNGLLLVISLKNSHIRREPWRWLIIHTSLCIFITAFLVYINLFTPAYLLPSFETTVICPAVKFIEQLFWQMYPVSITLVALERFRALKQKDWKSGGMGRKAVIISLTVFWIINFISHGLNFAIPHHRGLVDYYEGLPDKTMCVLVRGIVSGSAKFVITVWSLITMIVVIIGSAVLACKKPDADIKRSVVAPVLVVASTYLLFYFSSFILVMGTSSLGLVHRSYVFINMLFMPAWIIFPITWLVTWSRNGDFDWKQTFQGPCCPDQRDEEIQLLENGDGKE